MMDYSNKPTDDGQKGNGGEMPPPPLPVGMSDTPSAQAAPPRPAAPGQWTTGLFDCLEDIPNSCITFWCPCITFGQIAEIVDRGATSCGASGALYTLIAVVTGWPCMYSCFYRTKMRRQYALPESIYTTPVPDILVHGCCEFCALCQEYRELQNRGFDMAIGWDGNVDKQNQGYTTAPAVEGGMSR